MRKLNVVMSDIRCVQDKPWVYAHLLEIQRRVGRENFPLIEQVFYPSHSGMVRLHMDTLHHCTAALTLVPPPQDHKGSYPCVFKIGHAHGGLGKVRVETPSGFQVTTIDRDLCCQL